MTECPICLEQIDSSRYAIINSDGENGKYHVDDLEEWFSRHKTGILTQSLIKTYNVFENDEHTQTINVESHYSDFKVFVDEVKDGINFLWDTDPYLPDDEEEINSVWDTDPYLPDDDHNIFSCCC
jgi:hypothetical protein